MAKDGIEAVGRRKKCGQEGSAKDSGPRGQTDAGSGNIRSGIGRRSWVEKDMLTKFDVVGSSSSEAMP